MLEKMRLQCTVTSSLMSDQDHPISITQQNPVCPLIILGVATMSKNHQIPKHLLFKTLVPSPVLLDPKQNPKQSKIKIQVQLGLG